MSRPQLHSIPDRANGTRTGRGTPSSAIAAEFITDWRKHIKIADAPGKARVDVWLAPVMRLLDSASQLGGLAETDRSNSAEVSAQASRQCSRAGNTLLRTALSHAVGNTVQPSEWRIALSAHGKPVVAKGLPQINFSIAHSQEIVTVAVSDELPLGIDVEAVESLPTQALLELICSRSEQDGFKPDRRDQTSRDFIRLWTLKEAYAKMVGLGHCVDFASLDFAEASNLPRGPECYGPQEQAHFESIWVSAHDKFSHVSLSIGRAGVGSAVSIGLVELQLMTMAKPATGRASVMSTPHLYF